MTLERAYVNGRLAAFGRYKLGWPSATDPTVAGSGVLQAKGVSPTLPQTAQANMTPPTTPQSLAQIFDAHEQGETRAEPHRKLSADLCTTCRKPKHYGSCEHPRTIPTKAADFNAGMLGSDPTQGDNPSTSPHYHSAVSSISSLGRSSDGRPADEQAASGLADLFRHQGIRDSADQPGRMTGGLNKVAFRPGVQLTPESILVNEPITLADRWDAIKRNGLSGFTSHRPLEKWRSYDRPVEQKLADFFTNMPGAATHSMHEQRGTPINPYEERLTVKSPPLGWGDEGPQRIERAFDQIDCAADSTGIEDASKGQPSGGPAVLG